MAKKIIILDTRKTANGGTDVGVVFWFPVASGREELAPDASSMYSDVTPAELSALQAGTVFETPHSASFPQGTSKVQIQAALVTAYNSALTVFNARFNPKQFFGTFWDGTTWT